MRFVFDENFSRHLAEGLDLLEKSNPGRIIQVDIISAEGLMGRRGATDPELIKAAGPDGVVFTKDKDFKQIKLYAPVIEATGAKVLFYKYSKKMILFWDILTETVARWEEIKEKMSRPKPPFVYEFDIRAGVSERHF